MSEQIADLLISNAEPKEVQEEVTAVMLKKGRTVSVETLPTDFMMPGNPGLAIERKEMSDLMNTWFSEDERLSDQLKTLKMLEEANYIPALMVVGSAAEALSKRKGGSGRKQANRQSVTNLLMGIELQWKVHVFRVDQGWQVPYSLNYLIGKVHGEKTAVPFRHTAAKVMTPAQKATYVVQGLPGVGVKTSEKIRQHTRSLIEFLDGIAGEEPKELGLTKLQRDKIFEVLVVDWKESK